MNSDTDPFAGWEMAAVGCHWSRPLPDGRVAHLSTWASESQSGYTVTVEYTRCVFPGLDEAKAAYEFLSSAAPGTSITQAPGALIDV